MSQLVVLGFDTADEALEVLRSLRKLESEGQIKFEDTAVVSRDLDGKAHVKNELSGTTEAGAVVGGIIGVFVGALVLPLAGLAIGAAIGAGIAASLGTGVSRDFVDDVKAQLTPGKSALFLVIKDANIGPALAVLRTHHGNVIQTTLGDDMETQLRDALSGN
jgi:uncharacterized membrane protein